MERLSTLAGPSRLTGSDEGDDAATATLLGYSLELLQKEPELLKADAARVRRQLQELCCGSYPAFIETAATASTVRAEVASMKDHLAGLLDELPALGGGCARFAEAAERLAAARAQNRQLLQQHGALLDVLEAGSLLDTCVRNGSYEEALELDALVAKLAAHAPGPVTSQLQAEARAGVRLLLSTLLSRLRGSVQLPECLRCVGYLRRLAAFSEPQLRLAFLRARHTWLVGAVGELDPAGPAYEGAKRLTDVHRGGLFEVVMQYRAIFADDSAAADADESSLVHGWAAERVAAYLGLLGFQLGRLQEGALLAGVLEHALYCAASLGRVGLDFRGLLAPLLAPQLEAVVRRALADAQAGFERSLHHHRWAPPTAATHAMALAQPGGAPGAAASDAAAAPPPPSSAAPGCAPVPPAALVEQPPVGAFVNGVLAALNELRHAPLPGLRAPCASALHDTLRAGAATASRAARQLPDAQRPLARAMQAAYAQAAAPYVAACFGRLYDGGADLVDWPRALTEGGLAVAAA